MEMASLIGDIRSHLAPTVRREFLFDRDEDHKMCEGSTNSADSIANRRDLSGWV
jgi:hypothetical protein